MGAKIGAFFRACGARCRAFLVRRDPAEYFIAMMCVGLSVYAVQCLAGGADAMRDIFHLNCNDIYMDFFNSLRDVAQGIGVYTERHVIYPPLANMMLLFISYLIPEKYLNTPGAGSTRTWRNYPSALLCYTFFFLAAVLIVALLLQKENYRRVKKNLFTFLSVASLPMLCVIERGNIVIVCLIALLIYVQNYNSENRMAREIGLIALSFAAAFKLYPVLFAAPLLADRRYRDIFRCFIYGSLFLLIPSFFFGGPICLYWVLRNIFAFSESSSANAYSLMDTLGIPQIVGTIAIYAGYAVELGLLVWAALTRRKPWMLWMFATAIMLTIPSIFSSYNWVLFLAPLVVFFRTERLTGLNWVYFFGMALPFCCYFPVRFQDNFYIVLLGITCAAVLAECVIATRRALLEKKEKQTTAAD